MGTVSRVKDQGASMMSAIASLMEEEMDEEKERELIASIHDMVGTFYKYSAARLLPKGRLKDES